MDPKLISIFSIVIAYAAIQWNVSSYFHKLKQENFRIYADKHNNIIKPEIYDEWTACLNGDQTLYQKHRATMIAYLNLVWEQIYLNDQKLISKNLWKIWRELISSVVQKEFAKQIIFEFEYDDIIREFKIEKSK